MRFLILRARNRERSQSISGPISEYALLHAVYNWKLKLELRSSTNANTVAVAKSTGERGWKVNKKCLCVVLGLTRRSRVRKKFFFKNYAFWGVRKHEQQVIAYFQTHYDYGPQKMPLSLVV